MTPPISFITLPKSGQTLAGLHQTYGEAAPGQPLALIGSHGFLELAVRDGSAADTLNLGPGDRVTIRLSR